MPNYQFTVAVVPQYLPDRSAPEDQLYGFAYTITVTNTGDIPAQLIARHWIIRDTQGRSDEVKGLGVLQADPDPDLLISALLLSSGPGHTLYDSPSYRGLACLRRRVIIERQRSKRTIARFAVCDGTHCSHKDVLESTELLDGACSQKASLEIDT